MRVLFLLIAANVLIIAQAMAQQPAVDQPSGAAPAIIVGQSAAAIAAEGLRMGKLQRYQEEPNLIAEYEYYLWHGGCYIRQPSGTFYLVPIESCR